MSQSSGSLAEAAIITDQSAKTSRSPGNPCEFRARSARALEAVGLKREVAKELFNEFLAASIYTSNQVEFINLIINQLVDHGIVDVGLLYESPFTDISPTGPDALFTAEQVTRIIQLLERIKGNALAV